MDIVKVFVILSIVTSNVIANEEREEVPIAVNSAYTIEVGLVFYIN